MKEFTRWQRIEHAFHAVADDAPGPVRDARVLALCGHDTDLAGEVRALLLADAASTGPPPPLGAPPTPRS